MAADRTHPHSRRGRQFRLDPERLEERKLLTIDFKQGFFAIGDTTPAALITLVRSDASNGTANQTTEQAQVTVDSTGGATAIAGVDFEPISQTVTFGPGQTTQTILVPILSDPGTGTRTVHLSIAPSAYAPDGAAAYLSIMHGPDDTPPQIKSTNVLTNRNQVTGIQITFSKPMNLAAVENVNNYIVDNPKTARNTRGTHVTTASSIPLASETYDATTNTVTLIPSGRVRKAPYFEIESPQLAQAMQAMNSSSTPNVASLSLMSPITDTSGNALDSNSDGIPDGQLLIFAASGRMSAKLNKQLAAIQTSNTIANQT